MKRLLVPFLFFFFLLGFSFRASCGPSGSYSVEDRVKQFGTAVEKRVKPSFDAAGVSYPPSRMAILAFKDTRILEVYARNKKDGWKWICSYPIFAASGKLGPKLQQGDNQVPEGVYRMELLNPNSRFHLSIRVNYPNAFDRRMGKEDGRENLGGDIMIHGSWVSIGCLAVGDKAAEDLFVMAAHARKEKLPILISPTDFRKGAEDPVKRPLWIKQVYASLREELVAFPSDKTRRQIAVRP